jgi:hypothetical protein
MAVVKTLLRHGASPDLTDGNGWSSIQYGQMYPEIVQMFEEALRCKRPEVLVSKHSPLISHPNPLFPCRHFKRTCYPETMKRERTFVVGLLAQSILLNTNTHSSSHLLPLILGSYLAYARTC